jgi:hypothetical protein
MWEYLIGVITEPARALREVSEKKLWKEALLLMVVIALLSGAVSSVTFTSGLTGVEDPDVARIFSAIYNPGVFIPLTLVIGTLSWIACGAIVHLISKLFKGTGTVAGTVAALGFSSAPYLLSVPISALALLLDQATASIVGSAAGFVAGLWVLALDVVAVRESQQIETGQAIAAYLLTLLSGVIIFLIIGVIVGIIVAIGAIIAGVGAGL